MALNVPKFRAGQIVATPGALDALTQSDIRNSLKRHLLGDWGNVGEEDKKENELSLKEGFRLLSSYLSDGGTKFWIITEADRSSTTILLPDEY